MAYTPTNWENGETPINADNLNKIEQGLVALDSKFAIQTYEFTLSYASGALGTREYFDFDIEKSGYTPVLICNKSYPNSDYHFIIPNIAGTKARINVYKLKQQALTITVHVTVLYQKNA